MDGLEMDEPKDNMVSMLFVCDFYKNIGDCVYYQLKNKDSYICKYKNGNECTSQLAQVNRMVVDLKQRGIK